MAQFKPLTAFFFLLPDVLSRFRGVGQPAKLGAMRGRFQNRDNLQHCPVLPAVFTGFFCSLAIVRLSGFPGAESHANRTLRHIDAVSVCRRAGQERDTAKSAAEDMNFQPRKISRHFKNLNPTITIAVCNRYTEETERRYALRPARQSVA